MYQDVCVKHSEQHHLPPGRRWCSKHIIFNKDWLTRDVVAYSIPRHPAPASARLVVEVTMLFVAVNVLQRKTLKESDTTDRHMGHSTKPTQHTLHTHACLHGCSSIHFTSGPASIHTTHSRLSVTGSGRNSSSSGIRSTIAGRRLRRKSRQRSAML